MQRPERPCYYTTLQVDPSASHEEIRQAYKKQARAHHPDKHDHHNKETAENRFKDIGEAFAVLGDPHERAQYDMNREGPRRSRFSPPADQPPRGEAAGTWPMPGFGRFSPFEHDPFFQAPFGRGSMFGSDFFGGSLFGNMFGGGGGARQNFFNGFMGGEDLDDLFSSGQQQQQYQSQSASSSMSSSSFGGGRRGTSVCTETYTGADGRRITVKETTVHNADGTSETTREQF